MGLFVEFDVVRDFGYIDQTKKYGIVPDYSEGCEVFVETFLDIANQLVPVDTGYLQSTLTADYNDTYCYAETDCEYAQYPEFGTWCQPEQSYFRPALEEALMEAQPYWFEAALEALEIEEELLLNDQVEAIQSMSAYSGEPGPEVVGGIDYSSFGAFIGSVIGSFISAFIIVTAQVIFGKDFSSSRRMGNISIPEITIT